MHASTRPSLHHLTPASHTFPHLPTPSHTPPPHRQFSNFELGARVPLAIVAPSKPAGNIQDAVVELVDVMPTLLALAAVPPLPASQVLDGVSLVPLLTTPAGATTAAATDEEVVVDDDERVALSLYPRCPNGNVPSNDPMDWWRANACEFVDRTAYAFVGLSLRTARWRYTEWRAWVGAREAPDWGVLSASELYDHDGDDGSCFDCYENVNLVAEPARAADVKRLSRALRKAYDMS
jgi:hypothetical protein